jgi:O-antigen/teichoic acid export membrane protein
MNGFCNRLKNLLNDDFYRDIAGLFSGMFLARLFPAVFALAIVRIYSPENFGLFVLYLTIASVISIIATGKYENAIILAETTEERKHIFSLSQKINYAVGFATLFFVGIYILLFWVNVSERIYMLLMIPFYAFSLGATQLVRNILIGTKKFKILSSLEIWRAVATGAFQCAFFIFPVFGLFLGAVAGQLIVFLLYARTLPETREFRLSMLSVEEKKYALRYIDFPKYSVTSEMFNFISSQLPVFMVKPFFGETMLGLYSFSHRYISVPVQLISISISRVYIQKAQSLKNDLQALGSLTFSLFKKQFWTGVIPFTLLGLWGEHLFRLIFGAEWEFSGFLAQILAPWLFLVLLSSPLSSILIVFEKQRFSMVFNVALLITRVLSLAAGGLIFKDITTAIALYSLTGFLFFAALGGYSLKLAGVKLTDTLFFMLKALSLTILPLIIIKLWLIP